MEYGRSEYLKVNRELIGQLVEDVDNLMRNANYDYVMRKDSDDTDAYFVGEQANAVDQERQMLALRAGWAKMDLPELEKLFKGEIEKPLPYDEPNS
jgi:hypothetical protein